MNTFGRIKQPINSQQTHNQYAWLIISDFVCFLYSTLGWYLFSCKSGRSIRQPNINLLNGNRWIASDFLMCPIKWHALKIVSISTRSTVEFNGVYQKTKSPWYWVASMRTFKPEARYVRFGDWKEASWFNRMGIGNNEINNLYRHTNGTMQLNSISASHLKNHSLWEIKKRFQFCKILSAHIFRYVSMLHSIIFSLFQFHFDNFAFE